MLRITATSRRDAIRLRLEGRLIGPWVEELAGVWAEVRSGRVIVELSDVTFVSVEGRDLLARMAASGAELRAEDVMNRCLIEGIQLGLATHTEF